MSDDPFLITPRIIPPLDPDFRPASLYRRAFQQAVEEAGVGQPLVLGLERAAGEVTRYETRLLPAGHPHAAANRFYAERLLKFLLWQRGGWKVYAGGPAEIAGYLGMVYSPGGARRFDHDFMGRQVYEREFEIVPCSPSDVPAAGESGRRLGRHLNGCRVGFDLGASDRKACALIDGEVVFTEEVVWEPRNHADPAYHIHEIRSALRSAAAHLPRLDAIGGSSAGVIVNNRPMVASLFRAVPPERYAEIREIFLSLRDEFGVPMEVINDGDVTALAGAMSLERDGVLGIAMGSSEAAGYVDPTGHILPWLSELAFAPVDYSPDAPVDEWSGDKGVGALYFSQQCVFRLAPRAGIDIPSGIPDAERLAYVQKLLQNGHPGARAIWESMGVYLGYSLPHYLEFYAADNILVLGRCTSGQGGDLILENALRVLDLEFPELSGRLRIQLPDEKSRRVGQSIAAASLPEILSR